jgi:[acyl-carrier-protein] S-malonyltransferase
VDCVKTLIGEGPLTYIEMAPGKVLCGLLKPIDPEQKTLNVEDLASLEKTLAELKAAESAE